ncbi:helix-turn-helix domain-containing protein [Cohnella sp. AR92]|uniref:helix-turn-helix domain-containing protein n=1 Tax=Cohnella sp. AR92 TaxID=648716 RepID=UPI000F8CE992|nr:helix-turn-helix domain-containing protein [Cohnella sp. AR92]RUS42056.1 DNA-binding protein [Cohnella sp. AR92]
MPNILTAQDIADFLRISRKRVYELMQLSPSHGGIPCFSVGKSRRVERSDFEKWLASRKAS